MTGKVNIGGVEVGMTANAATPFRFKQIFGEDFFQLTTKGLDDAASVDTFIKIGFCMAMQYEGKTKATEEDFYDWLAGFETNALIEALGDVANLYAGTEKTSVDPKE